MSLGAKWVERKRDLKCWLCRSGWTLSKDTAVSLPNEGDTAVFGVLPPDCLLSDSQEGSQIQALSYLLY